MSETYLTATDVALRLKISRALAYRLLASGEISAVRFGRTVRIRESDLEEFIRAHSSDPSHAGSIAPVAVNNRVPAAG